MSRPGDGTGDVKLSGSIIVVAVILLFAAFLFLFFIYLRAKHYWGACPPLRRARARLVFATEQIGFPRRGLDPALIQALPSVVFYAKDLKAGIECAVCLNELSDGEAARMLPKCSHGFHLDCIDMWLHSNSTCPLCRSPVVAEPPPDTMPVGVLHPEMVVVTDGHSLNSLGEVQQGSSSSGESSLESLDAGMLVTEIPSNSPLPSASLVVLEEVRIA